jgi:outer membrane protein OmpA-like peptidoglycan-associated protein
VKFFLILPLCFLLASCASSNVSRTAASNVDQGVQNAKNLTQGGDMDVADQYQNSSQATKGAIIGGAVGAITGSLSTTVGFVPGTAIGAILGASYGSYIDSQTTLEDRLINRGVTMIVLGDQVMIILPSSRIFCENGSSIKDSGASTLWLVSQYINQYTTMLVKITAYTNSSPSPRMDFALSQEQAENVEKYLVLSGTNARLLYAEGAGGTKLVSQNCAWTGANYRIEITFEKLYV